MSWNSLAKNFCEGINDGFPENFNAFTSILFILPMGMWGLLRSKLRNDLTRFIYVFLALNGVGSFLLHYYGYRFYGLLDTITLNLVSWFLNYFVIVIVLNSIRQKVNISEEISDKILDLTCLVDMCFCLFFIMNDSVSGKPWGIEVTFAEGFAICQIFTILCCIFLCIFHRSNKVFVIYTSVGMVYLLVAVVIWISTEPYCVKGEDNPKFYDYTHGLWHIFSIHSSHMIIQSLFYIDVLTKGGKSGYVTSDNKFMKVIYYLFPIAEEKELLPVTM
jgi:hypothetical protein